MGVSLADAVAWIARGGVLAYPTETVWGLGADARSDAAVAGLRAFKGRSDDAPLSVLVSGVAALAPLGFRVDATAQRLAAEFWPGPLTLVLRCDGRFARGVASGATIGVRCSPHPAALELARRCERARVGPPTATSCNASGEPPAATRADARRVCDDADRVALLACDDDAAGGDASTVVDLGGDAPRVLRWGAIREPALRPVLEELAAA